MIKVVRMWSLHSLINWIKLVYNWSEVSGNDKWTLDTEPTLSS